MANSFKFFLCILEKSIIVYSSSGNHFLFFSRCSKSKRDRKARRFDQPAAKSPQQCPFKNIWPEITRNLKVFSILNLFTTVYIFRQLIIYMKTFLSQYFIICIQLLTEFENLLRSNSICNILHVRYLKDVNKAL